MDNLGGYRTKTSYFLRRQRLKSALSVVAKSRRTMFNKKMMLEKQHPEDPSLGRGENENFVFCREREKEKKGLMSGMDEFEILKLAFHHQISASSRAHGSWRRGPKNGALEQILVVNPEFLRFARDFWQIFLKGGHAMSSRAWGVGHDMDNRDPRRKTPAQRLFFGGWKRKADSDPNFFEPSSQK